MIAVRAARRLSIRRRIRRSISGSSAVPRLSVFKSNRSIYAQLIDDEAAKTLGYSSSVVVDAKASCTVALARKVGLHIAERAKEQGISQVVFDRGGYPYHGKVKGLAEGAREGGLIF